MGVPGLHCPQCGQEMGLNHPMPLPHLEGSESLKDAESLSCRKWLQGKRPDPR